MKTTTNTTNTVTKKLLEGGLVFTTQKVLHVSISKSEDKKKGGFFADYDIVSKGMSRLTAGLPTIETSVKTEDGIKTDAVLANFVSVYGDDQESRELLERGLKFNTEGKALQVYAYNQCKKCWYNLKTKKEISPKYADKFVTFIITPYSPAQEKGKEANQMPEDQAFLIIDDAHDGALSVTWDYINNAKNGIIQYPEATKQMARFSQALAPSMEWRRKMDIAIYFAKPGFTDGEAILSEKLFTGEDLLGHKLQGRTAAIKFGAPIREAKYIIKMMENTAPIIYLTRAQAALEQKELTESFFEKEGKYRNKVVIISDNPRIKQEGPDLYVDLDCMKLPYLFDRELTLSIMSISGKNQKETNVSVQMLAQMLGNKDYLDILLKKGYGMINSEVEKSFTRERKIPTMEEMEQGYVPGLVKSYAPEFVFEDSALLQTAVADTINVLDGRNKRVSFKLPGGYFVGTVDPLARLLGRNISLFKNDEVFCPGMESTFDPSEIEEINGKKGNGEKLTTFERAIDMRLSAWARHPKPGLEDMPVKRVLSLEEVKSKLLAKKQEKLISNYEYNLLKEAYASTDRQCVIMNSEELVLLIHAGSDWDQDAFSASSDPAFVTMASRVPVVATKIVGGSSEPSKTKFKVGLRMFGKIYCQQIDDNKLPVGSIANLVRLINALLHDREKGERVLSLICKGKGSKYSSPLVHKKVEEEGKFRFNKGGTFLIEIDKKKVDLILSRIKALDIKKVSESDYEKVVKDMTQIGIMYVQETIDSSKDGAIINIPDELKIIRAATMNIAVNKDFELKVSSDFKLSLETNQKALDRIMAKKGKSPFKGNDLLLREQWVKYSKDLIEYYLKDTQLGFKEDTLEALAMARSYMVDFPGLKEEMLMLKRLYSNVSGLCDKKTAKDKFSANREKKAMLRAISDMARNAFAIRGIKDPVMQGLMGIEVSRKADGTSGKFAAAILPQEYMAAVLHIKNVPLEVAVPILGSKLLRNGDYVMIENGKVVAKKPLRVEGERIFHGEEKEVVKYVGGKYYVERTICKLEDSDYYGNAIVIDIDTEFVSIKNGGFIEKDESFEGRIIKIKGQPHIVRTFEIKPQDFDPNNILLEINTSIKKEIDGKVEYENILPQIEEAFASATTVATTKMSHRHYVDVNDEMFTYQYTSVGKTSTDLADHLASASGEIVLLKVGQLENSSKKRIDKALLHFTKKGEGYEINTDEILNNFLSGITVTSGNEI